MHTLTRSLIVVGVLLAGLLTDAQPALADGMATGYTNGEGVTARVDNKGSASPIRPSDGKPSEEVCIIKDVNPMKEGLFRVDKAGKLVALFDEQHPEDKGRWQRRTCTRGRALISEQMYWVANVVPTDLAQQALDSAQLPTPAISLRPENPLITFAGYPEWLWIQPDAWRTVTASASLDGLTATVTAVPTQVLWDSGDTSASDDERYVKCNGPGKALPFRAGYMDRREDSGCTYYYRHISIKEPDHAFDLSATIQWNVTWTATNGTSGNLGVVSRAASIPVKVGEWQVVNVSPRERNEQ
jgi:hypothetical protein